MQPERRGIRLGACACAFLTVRPPVRRGLQLGRLLVIIIALCCVLSLAHCSCSSAPVAYSCTTETASSVARVRCVQSVNHFRSQGPVAFLSYPTPTCAPPPPSSLHLGVSSEQQLEVENQGHTCRALLKFRLAPVADTENVVRGRAPKSPARAACVTVWLLPALQLPPRLEAGLAGPSELRHVCSEIVLHVRSAQHSLELLDLLRSTAAASDAVLRLLWHRVVPRARADPLVPAFASLLAALETHAIVATSLRNSMPVRLRGRRRRGEEGEGERGALLGLLLRASPASHSHTHSHSRPSPPPLPRPLAPRPLEWLRRPPPASREPQRALRSC